MKSGGELLRMEVSLEEFRERYLPYVSNLRSEVATWTSVPAPERGYESGKGNIERNTLVAEYCVIGGPRWTKYENRYPRFSCLRNNVFDLVLTTRAVHVPR